MTDSNLEQIKVHRTIRQTSITQMMSVIWIVLTTLGAFLYTFTQYSGLHYMWLYVPQPASKTAAEYLANNMAGLIIVWASVAATLTIFIINKNLRLTQRAATLPLLAGITVIAATLTVDVVTSAGAQTGRNLVGPWSSVGLLAPAGTDVWAVFILSLLTLTIVPLLLSRRK